VLLQWFAPSQGGEPMQQRRDIKPNTALIAFKGCRAGFISAAIFSGIINILMLTGPLFMLQIYDRVLASGSVPTLAALSLVVLLLYMFYAFLDVIRSRVLIRLGRRVEEQLREPVFDAVADHALRKSRGVGAQPLTDLQTLRSFATGQGALAFFDLPWVPIYLGVIFLMHWWLGVASAVAAATIFVLALASELRTRRPTIEAVEATVKAASISDEVRRHAEAMHALGMRPAIRQRWSAIQQQALDHNTHASDTGGTLGGLSRMFRLVIQSGILALGALLALQGEITPGAMIAASIIMSRALAPVEQAVANWQQFLSARRAFGRLGAVMADASADTVKMKLPKPSGNLAVENLIVAVPGTEKPLLQGITFNVEAGRALGIIGPTGAGKSTLARVIVGILKPTRGTVRLDGSSLDQFDPDLLGGFIGYVPQESQIFDGTVAENISRFSEVANFTKIIEAARLANIHDLVQKLPDGYNTRLGESGARLSAGQRQRVALARALYGNPVMLVLDEPNANLDAEGEAALDRAIRHTLQRNASVIVIAHRPNAIAAVDHIIVLNDGRIAGSGPRDEIIRKVVRAPGAQIHPLQQVQLVSG
jgi:PrtD family type I secretion system ABC transporter